MIDTTQLLNRLQYSVHCRLYYTRLCLKFGWVEEKMSLVDEDSKTQTIYFYKNYNTGEESRVPPVYTAIDHYCACKIQSIWSCYLAKKYMKSLLIRDSMVNIAYSAIVRYQQVAFIGYEMEGVSIPQILYRSGFVDLAQSIETYFKSRPQLSKDYSPDDLLTLPKEKYSTIGVTKHSDVKDLDRYKDWYSSLSSEKRLAGVKFINSFRDHTDLRTMKECIQTGESFIRSKLNKAYKNSLSRIQNILASILNSKYPITKFQLDAYLDLFSGKAGLAQDNVFIIVDKPTTSNYEEEREAYLILKGATRRILAIMKACKMMLLYKYIQREEVKAAEIMKQCDEETIKLGPKREKASYVPFLFSWYFSHSFSGLEARAALILRVEVMEYVIRVEEATFLLQKRFRGLTRRLSYLRVQAKRLKVFFHYSHFPISSNLFRVPSKFSVASA